MIFDDDGWMDRFCSSGLDGEPRFRDVSEFLKRLIDGQDDHEWISLHIDCVAKAIIFAFYYEQLQPIGVKAVYIIRGHLSEIDRETLETLQQTLQSAMADMRHNQPTVKQNIDALKAYLLTCMTLGDPDLAESEIKLMKRQVESGNGVSEIMHALIDLFESWRRDQSKVISEHWFAILENAVEDNGDDDLILKTHALLTTWALYQGDSNRTARYASLLYSAARTVRDSFNMYVAATYLAIAYQRMRMFTLSWFWLGRIAEGADHMHPASTLTMIAGHFFAMDRFVEAAAKYHEAWTLLNADSGSQNFRLDLPHWKARALVDLGYALVWAQYYDDASEKLNEGLKMFRKHKDSFHEASTLHKIAIMYAHQWQRKEALLTLEDANVACMGITDEKTRKGQLASIADTRRRIENGELGPTLHATKQSQP